MKKNSYILRRSIDTFGYIIVKEESQNETIDRVFILPSESGRNSYDVLRLDFKGDFPKIVTLEENRSIEYAKERAQNHIREFGKFLSKSQGNLRIIDET